MDEEKITELDLDTYISWYAHELTTYFPRLYTEEDLFKMLHKSVEHIYLCDIDNEDFNGEYIIYEKTIRVRNLTDRQCLFHEFTHALRACYFNYMIVPEEHLSGNQNGDYFASRKFNDADEGMTELISILYGLRKKNNNPSLDVIKVKRNKNIYRYLYGALYFNQIHQMYKMLHGKSLIDDYLKGENIYKYLYDVIYTYLLEIHDNEDECLELAYRLSNIVLTYLADFGYNKPIVKDDNPDDYYSKLRTVTEEKTSEELYTEYSFLEYLNKQILMKFPYNSEEDIDTINFMGKNFLTIKMDDMETRIRNRIFGIKEHETTFEELYTIVSNYIVECDNNERS